MKENFPIFNGFYNLTNEEVLRYLATFPEHDIMFTKVLGKCSSLHEFKDGLTIKAEWNVLKTFPPFSSHKEKHFSSVEDLVRNGYISVEKAYILFFSDVYTSVTERAYHNFQEIIQYKLRNLPSDTYKKLEYPDVELQQLSDEFFDNKVRENQNVINFYRYLKEKDASVSPSNQNKEPK